MMSSGSPIVRIGQSGQERLGEGECFELRIVGEFRAAAARCFDHDMDVAVFREGRQLGEIRHSEASSKRKRDLRQLYQDPYFRIRSFGDRSSCLVGRVGAKWNRRRPSESNHCFSLFRRGYRGPGRLLSEDYRSVFRANPSRDMLDPEAVIILSASLDEAWNRLLRSGSECTRPAYARAMRRY